jgi:hypothetical protein
MFCNQDTRNLACAVNASAFCACIHAMKIDLGDVVELIIVDGGSQEGARIFLFKKKYSKIFDNRY